jgi:sister-chromatid-cohesion protein PDS5
VRPLDIASISLIVQDPLFRPRRLFVERICKLLQLKKIPFEFISLLPLIAHEPDAELKQLVSRFLMKICKQQSMEDPSKGAAAEKTFTRLLYILSHHPDFSTDLGDIQLFSAYISFFLQNVATALNVSYLYYMAAKIKTAKDATVDSNEVDCRSALIFPEFIFA